MHNKANRTQLSYTIPKFDFSIPLSNYQVTTISYDPITSIKSILANLLNTPNLIILHNEGIGYLSDMQFDFETGQLYVPIYHCDEYTDDELTKKQLNILNNVFGDDHIRANYSIEKFVIIDRTSDFLYHLSTSFLTYIIPPTESSVTQTISHLPLTPYPLTNPVDYSKEQPIQNLFNLYLLSSFSYRESQDINRYVHISKNYISLLKSYNLPLWSGYYTLSKYPNMQYTKESIKSLNIFPLSQLNQPYRIRRLPYLFALYFSLIEKTIWTNLTKGDIRKVQSGEQLFCRYTENDHSLIIKREWYVPPTVSASQPTIKSPITNIQPF